MSGIEIVGSVAAVITMLLVWRWRLGSFRRWMADGLRAKIADYREGARLELRCPEGSTVHAFGRLHMAIADLFDVIADAIGGQDAD